MNKLLTIQASSLTANNLVQSPVNQIDQSAGLKAISYKTGQCLPVTYRCPVSEL
jgi:hypothetical protein